MNISEEQKAPFIILCCLIVLVLAFGVYRAMGTSTQAATKKAAVKAEKSVPSSEAKKVESQPMPVMVAENAGGKPKDPFTPRVVPKAAPAHQPTFSAGSRPLPLVSQAAGPLLPVIPTLPVGPIGVGGDSTQDIDPTQGLKLTGVVEGEVNVAIIRGGENVRYIVREGQSIDGKFIVESVTKNGVCLKYEGKRFFLKLGGNDAVDGTRA